MDAGSADTRTLASPPAELTPRQREIHGLIYAAAIANRPVPTLREIGQVTGIRSPNGICSHLKPLARKGWISWDYGRSRSLRPLRTPEGRRIAGFGVLTVEED